MAALGRTIQTMDNPTESILLVAEDLEYLCKLWLRRYQVIQKFGGAPLSCVRLLVVGRIGQTLEITWDTRLNSQGSSQSRSRHDS